MSEYKKYDDSTQELVVRSGNPKLFPELNIPRTTALYWIRRAKKKVKVKDCNLDKALTEKINRLEKELEIERARNLFLSYVIKNLYGLQKIYNHKKNRENIVFAIEKFKKWLPITSLCRGIGMSCDKYYRLRVEIKGGPKISFNKCRIMAANQITFREQ